MTPNPCKCGRPVKVQYINAMSRRLQAISENMFAGDTPAYYIFCEGCGRHVSVRLPFHMTASRKEYMLDLITTWNEVVNK